MSTIPSNWSSTVLSEVALVEMGQSPDSRFYNDQGNGLPFFQGKAEFGKLYPVVRKWCSEPTKVAESGDILLSVRAPVGPTNVASEKSCIGRGLAAIRAFDEIEQKYLLFFLRNIEPWLMQQGTGTTFKAISGDFIRNIEIPIAPLNEQKRIADKLDMLLARVDACREHLDQVKDILKRFRQAVLAAAVSGRLTEDWRTKNEIDDPVVTDLNQTGSKFSYGSSAKSKSSGNTPVLRMGNIQNGKLDWSDLVYTSDSKEIEKYTLSLGDVLFNRTNSPELVGKTAVYNGEKPAIYAGYLIRIRCGSQVLPDYLNYCLNSPMGRAWCWEVKSDGVSQSNINATKLGEFQFLLPTMEEQQEIIRLVKKLFSFSDNLAEHYRTARSLVDELTPSLLGIAFSGELVPQDPNDEPASTLLERIRLERHLEELGAATRRKPAKKETDTKGEGRMRTLSEIKSTHLSDILKENGSMLAERLWAASELEIEDFYEQLKDEEMKELLREIRNPLNDLVSVLEQVRK